MPLEAEEPSPPSQHTAHSPPLPPGLWESILKLPDIHQLASHRDPVHILGRGLSGMVLEFLLYVPGTCIASSGTPASASPGGYGTCYHQ